MLGRLRRCPSHGKYLSRRILLVEDNADVREMLQTLLELAGHRVQTAEDGLAGLEAASRTRPDAVVIDLGLPRLDGRRARAPAARACSAGGCA